MVRYWKRRLFGQIREHYLARTVSDLRNFLRNVEVERGISPLEGARVLIIAPHPDDESIGCGGTLRLLSNAGTTIDALFVTRGENHDPLDPTIPEVRRREAEESCALLGVQRITFLDAPDGSLHRVEEEVATEILHLLERDEYYAIFCPWPYDGHSDHAATFRSLARALRAYPGDPQLWLYEVWNALLANRVVNIDDTLEVKLEAIRRHSSQTEGIDYAGKFRGLAEYRSLICPPARHAEAFFVARKRLIHALAAAG